MRRGYYLALRRDCPSCTILAPDLLDITDRRYAVNEVTWAHELIRALGFEPSIWALNNYVGANSLETGTTTRLLAAVKGDIWFVETAGIVSEPHHAGVASATNLSHQAMSTASSSVRSRTSARASNASISTNGSFPAPALGGTRR